MWFFDIFLYIFGFLPSEKTSLPPAILPPPPTVASKDGITPSESASRIDDYDSDLSDEEEGDVYRDGQQRDDYYDDDSISATSTARYNSKSAPSPFMLSKFARPNVHAKQQLPVTQERRVSIGGVEEEDERHKEVLTMWLGTAHTGSGRY